MSWRARAEIRSVGVQSEIDGTLLDKASEYFQRETESRWKSLASFVQTPKADSRSLLLPLTSRQSDEGEERALGNAVGSLSGAAVVTRLMEQRVSFACQAQESELQSLRAKVATLCQQVAQRDRIIAELLARGGWMDEVDVYKARADGESTKARCSEDSEDEDNDNQMQHSSMAGGESPIVITVPAATVSEGTDALDKPQSLRQPSLSQRAEIDARRAQEVSSEEPQAPKVKHSSDRSPSPGGVVLPPTCSSPTPPPPERSSEGRGGSDSSATRNASTEKLPSGAGNIALPAVPASYLQRRRNAYHLIPPAGPGSGAAYSLMGGNTASKRYVPATSGKVYSFVDTSEQEETADDVVPPIAGSVSAPLSGSFRGPPGAARHGRRADRYAPAAENGSRRGGRPSSAGAMEERGPPGMDASALGFSLRISSGAGVKTVAMPAQDSTQRWRRGSKPRPPP
eukprot:CAMPEP_0178421428 /NCGR_PEP_ID=MMETSP0689_2-20121128/26641_1 /TAXON_ID=160604 /ORGANISM="Amphidinium massartii, Strain CS-259" /LENGTH=455 /DNA_ID=CAMNT_0020042937 /DNA_START=38 /DNA_END=1402 /DNA_ORIENTATION=+